jgi:hypothetical protein
MGAGRRRTARVALAALAGCALSHGGATAYELTDELSIEAVGTVVFQYGDFDGSDVDDELEGSGVVDLALSYRPTPLDEFQAALSFAGGNALNDVAPLSLAPYADDLEDDLEDINNRDRDYLLTAWYRHEFRLAAESGLALTGGIIDSTAYLDPHAYANDEVGQFMNDTFVNSTLANLPSYDYGVAAELALARRWTFTFVWMNSKTGNEDLLGRIAEETFNYLGTELGYHAETPLGAGNYRLLAYTTDDSFIARDGAGLEALLGVGVSLDQQLTDQLGLFARLGWQDDAAAVDHDVLVSLGVSINGALWGRAQDEIGAALAHLSGAAGSGLDATRAAEAYVEFGVTEWASLTFDLQYIEDDVEAAADPQAVIYGTRLNLFF